ncbi:uncharacterized protein B0H18DRAFT_668469 [Fomitopsis serialis]|uniref:uncharacterized protein n=1 Tax=Fomitopsis serialis TaxID=139415 RepID=UPI002008D3FE|nr:uncharacterized protein B0H18DRAFT_668469 [Neoantrodia serialis]KAH9918453.1 hypothetical protein B0H18DRAFT_668469 [Neoantrodia serialis]
MVLSPTSMATSSADPALAVPLGALRLGSNTEPSLAQPLIASFPVSDADGTTSHAQPQPVSAEDADAILLQQYIEQHFTAESGVIRDIQSRQEQLQGHARPGRSHTARNRRLPLNLWLFRFRMLKTIFSHFGIPVNSPLGTVESRVPGSTPQLVGSRVQGKTARVTYQEIFNWAGVEANTAANIRPIYLHLEAAYRANHP